MMILTGRTIVSALRPPYPYGGELVSQFLFTLRLVWFPLLITTVAINYGAPGLQAGDFLTLFGAVDRLGGFFVLASIREIGPLITSIVLAGVAGTAITADLGARKIREELDALQVLGVDPASVTLHAVAIPSEVARVRLAADTTVAKVGVGTALYVEVADQFGNDLAHIANESVGGDGKHWRFGIIVDGNNNARIFHTSQVLYGT